MKTIIETGNCVAVSVLIDRKMSGISAEFNNKYPTGLHNMYSIQYTTDMTRDLKTIFSQSFLWGGRILLQLEYILIE